MSAKELVYNYICTLNINFMPTVFRLVQKKKKKKKFLLHLLLGIVFEKV